MTRLVTGLTLVAAIVVGVSFSTTSLLAQTVGTVDDIFIPDVAWGGSIGPSEFPGRSANFADAFASAEPEASSRIKLDGENSKSEDVAESQPQRAAAQSGSQDSALDRVTDPTSPNMNFRFRQSWNWPVDDAAPDNQEFQFRPTIPFKAWDHENVLRVTIPYDIEGADGQGLDKVTILDLIAHKTYWGRWGMGPVVRFSPNNGPDSDTFQIGPAAGAISKDERWTIGFLGQNFFGGDVAESRIQPILTYKFDEQWAVGVGEFEFRYDWHNATWTQVPLGVQLDYIANIYGQKVQLFVNPQYNFADESSNSGWTVFLGLTLIMPDS
jgi:hypothetical protein